MISSERMGKHSREPVTAVIPAFNEADHIGQVLHVLSQVDVLEQIIVVDDGSQDATAEQVAKAALCDSRIELISQKHNGGKGRALLAGAKRAAHDLLLFLDADLMDLQPHHIPSLIEPVRTGCCDMTLGIFEEGRWHTDFTHRLFPFLSGQRCLRWPLFQGLFEGNSARWSIETAFNLHARYHDLELEHVALPGVTHATRAEKKEGLAGYWSHVRMWWQIISYSARFFVAQRVSRELGSKKERSHQYAPATGSKYRR